MARWMAVVRARGPGWDRAKPMREQPLWDEHARFIDDLTERGIVRLGGPLEGTEDALIIMRSDDAQEVEALLASDPWTAADLLATTRIAPWNVLVGDL